MTILLRQPFKTIYLLGFIFTSLFIRLPWWFIFYSWPPNRARNGWSLRRTMNVQILRQVTQLPMKFGVVGGRDLSLEVPQKELESLDARFVWIPELGDEDVVGTMAEHANRAGVKSIAIPAYWILKEGAEWSPAHEKALKDEKTMLYFHGGAFVVSFFSFVPSRTNSRFRPGAPTHLTQRHPFPEGQSNTPHVSPEHCRSTTDSVLESPNPETRSQVRC